MKGWQIIVPSFLLKGSRGRAIYCKWWMFPYSTYPLHIAPRHSQLSDVEASQHLFFSSGTRCHLRFAGGKWLIWVGYLSAYRSSNQHRTTSNRIIEESINRLLNKMNYPHPKQFWRWFCSPIPVRYLAMYKTYFCCIRNRRWRPQFTGSLRRRRRKGNLSIFTLDVVRALRSLVEYHAGVAEVL